MSEARKINTMPRIRLLIADDDMILQSMLQELLTQVTVSEIVAQVACVADLCAAVQKNCPELVLLDWHLPGEPNDALLERLRELCPRVRIIVMETRVNESSRAHPTHADAIIDKSETAWQLWAALAVLITQLISERTRPAFYA